MALRIGKLRGAKPLAMFATMFFLAFEQRCHDEPRTLGSSFYACSEEQQDLSLVEAMHRLLRLALDKVRTAGIIAEDAVLAIVDAVMGFAVDMLQTEKRLAQSKT